MENSSLKDLSRILPRVLVVSRRTLRKNKFVDFVGNNFLKCSFVKTKHFWWVYVGFVFVFGRWIPSWSYSRVWCCPGDCTTSSWRWQVTRKLQTHPWNSPLWGRRHRPFFLRVRNIVSFTWRTRRDPENTCEWCSYRQDKRLYWVCSCKAMPWTEHSLLGNLQGITSKLSSSFSTKKSYLPVKC